MTRSIFLLLLIIVASTTLAAQERYTYDAAGRLLTVTYANGAAIEYSYDANGNILTARSSVSSAPGADAAAGGVLRVQPNPASDEIAIDLGLPSDTHGTVELLRLDGTLAAEVRAWGPLAARTLRWRVPVSVASGSYLMRLRTIDDAGGMRTVSTRLVVLR